MSVPDTEQVVDLRDIKRPDSPGEDVPKLRRQAYIYDRVMDMGHPSLVDKVDIAEKFGVSRRQVYYDLEDVARSISEHEISKNHIGENMPVFEKAKREALREGDWQGAVKILREQAEWLEDRGELDKEPDEHEVTWRHYIEDGNTIDDSDDVIDV